MQPSLSLLLPSLTGPFRLSTYRPACISSRALVSNLAFLPSASVPFVPALLRTSPALLPASPLSFSGSSFRLPLPSAFNSAPVSLGFVRRLRFPFRPRFRSGFPYSPRSFALNTSSRLCPPCFLALAPPQDVGSLFARLVLFPSASPSHFCSDSFVRLPRLSRFALSVPVGFRLCSYLFGPLRLLLLRVPSPDEPSPTVRHLESSAHASDLSSLRCPSSFRGPVRFPGCFALACILQMISFPFPGRFRPFPVLSSTLLLIALSSSAPFRLPVSRHLRAFPRLISSPASFASLSRRNSQYITLLF